MARIRSIKPEFPQSESMGNVSRDARLCFVMLWTIADDSGRLRGNSRMLASLLFPYDDDAPGLMDGWLAELDREGCIARYQVEGANYVEISKWLSHQKIDKPSPSKIPPFDESSRILANPRERSSEDLDLGMDQGEEGNGKRSAPKRESSPPAPPPFSPSDVLADGVNPDHLRDWLKVRKAKRAPLTQAAWDELKTEAAKAGITPAEAVAICARKSWQGFNAGWNWRDQPTARGSPPVNLAAKNAAAKRLLFPDSVPQEALDA